MVGFINPILYMSKQKLGEIQWTVQELRRLNGRSTIQNQIYLGTSLVVQWLRLCSSKARGLGSISGWFPHAAWSAKKREKKIRYIFSKALLSTSSRKFSTGALRTDMARAWCQTLRGTEEVPLALEQHLSAKISTWGFQLKNTVLHPPAFFKNNKLSQTPFQHAGGRGEK